MPVEEQLNIIFQILQAGRNIPIEEATEVVADTGTSLAVVKGSTEVATLGNGMATEVTSLVVDSTATEVTTTGVGLLALDVSVAGAICAPFLGLAIGGVAGNALYELNPEFWLNVSDSLLEAGQTVGGKVRAFLNSDTKTVGLTEETIEIFKNALLETGLFSPNIQSQVNTDNLTPAQLNAFNRVKPLQPLPKKRVGAGEQFKIYRYANSSGRIYTDTYTVPSAVNDYYMLNIQAIGDTFTGIYGAYWGVCSENDIYLNDGTILNATAGPITGLPIAVTIAVSGAYAIEGAIAPNNPAPMFTEIYGSSGISTGETFARIIADIILHGEQIGVSYIQDGAIIPDNRPIPEIYPSINPWLLPDGATKIYPVEIPAINPNPDQSEAQNPNPLPDDNPDLLPWFIQNLPQPAPDPNPYPEPVPVPDPDPQPEPEPIPEPSEPDTDPNPVDPNPDPSDPYLPIIPEVPDTVPANAMFTVYKPTMSQVNSFGSWLWSNSIMEAIKRIWQNPLDGIISFMKVYVDAPTSGSDTIKVGMLDSEVSSAVVTNQFVTVECGTIDIKEKFYNATDYSPFVSLHIYLPFIGIAELDIDEFMSGEIKVTYHVDVYTGTCLAEIKGKRSYDKPDWTIIYTFSGNASQQLPLTSSSFSGAISSLVSIVGGGLAIASGGGLGLLAGATGLAHAVTHEMVHLAHSGSLSANAGIMGARKPFLIITRRRSYDANGYNELYGYPSNKTVFLNNCSGFVKVKDIQLKTSATDIENKEIETLLKNGVIM